MKKQNWNVKPLSFSITSCFIRQTRGNFHFHCLPCFHIFWSMHKSPQFAVILFLKEPGSLIRKKSSAVSGSRPSPVLPPTSKAAPAARRFRRRRKGWAGALHLRICFLWSFKAKGANLEEDYRKGVKCCGNTSNTRNFYVKTQDFGDGSN